MMRTHRSISLPAAAAMLLAGGCTTVPASGQREAIAAKPIAVPVCPTETRGWQAWIDAMPGPNAQPTLIVQGEALLPERAAATLTAGPLDRMQPPTQRVTLAVEPSVKAAGWAPLRVEIPSPASLRAVSISCDGAEIARIEPVTAAQ